MLVPRVTPAVQLEVLVVLVHASLTPITAAWYTLPVRMQWDALSAGTAVPCASAHLPGLPPDTSTLKVTPKPLSKAPASIVA